MTDFEYRPGDVIIPSQAIPGVYWNTRTGLVCTEDGRPLKWNPFEVDEDRTGVLTGAGLFDCRELQRVKEQVDELRRRLPRMKYRKMMPVLAKGRFGYWVGYRTTNVVHGVTVPVDPPVYQVQFSGRETADFEEVDVVKARFFADYLLNPNGVGKTGFVAFLLILVGCIAGTSRAALMDDWTVWLYPGVFVVFLLGTWLNFKGVFK